MSLPADQILPVPTSQGPARVHVHAPSGTATERGSVLLGHGAGGGIEAADLQAVTEATRDGWTVGLVEQPWRVAGRRVATPPPRLDAAWGEVLGFLSSADPPTPGLPRPLVVGGRSAGARVACRTCLGDQQSGLPRADAVLALAFPLHPPARPERSRAGELQRPVDHAIPTLVVQGGADPFGTGEDVLAAVSGPSLRVAVVPGTHSPTPSLDILTETVRAWLRQLP